MNRLVEQRKKDAEMATPKRFRPKLNQFGMKVIQKPNFEHTINSPFVKEPELLLTPEYSRFPSALNVSIPLPQIPAIFYPKKLQEANQQEQPQSLRYFNKPVPFQANTKAEIKVDGNIVMIRSTNNETLTFNKKLMIGFQAAIAEEKLTVFLKSNTLVLQMIYNEDWAKIIEMLHLIITNRSLLPQPTKPTKPTLLSKLAKCFQKKQQVTSASQSMDMMSAPNVTEPVSP